MDLLKEKRIDIDDNKYRPFLKNLQAGILKNHGRDHLAILLLKFNDREYKEVRTTLSKLPLNSALDQFRQIVDYKANRKKKFAYKSDTFILQFFLSVKGYKTLRLHISKRPKDAAFVQGMERRDLQDTSKSVWEPAFREELDGLVFLAGDQKGVLENQIQLLKEQWQNRIDILKIQWGKKIRNDAGQSIEHFGYANGISQPLFLKSDFEGLKTDHWNPEAPLSLVLAKDPGCEEDYCFGSYLVFRKLEQNVKAFRDAEIDLAEKLGFHKDTEALSGAMILGRFKNGLPLLKLGGVVSSAEASRENDFNYQHDPKGDRCPFQAHIRKMNPRGDSQRAFQTPLPEERSHRIVRRSMPYDEIGRRGNPSILPEGGVGLLFLCFQANIEKQFEFIQKHRANNPDFPKAFTGLDPLIGNGKNRTNNTGAAAEQKWRKIDDQIAPVSISSFITLKGGGYFFAPSLLFIRSLEHLT